jgi:RNA polymerase sigma-70 factor (ECF subfamily)
MDDSRRTIRISRFIDPSRDATAGRENARPCDRTGARYRIVAGAGKGLEPRRRIPRTAKGSQMTEFEEFYLATKDVAYRAVLVVAGDRASADDAVSEAYARALARWSTLREHPQPLAWVLRTAVNVQRSWWRRLRREALGTVPESGAEPSLPVGADPALRDAIRALPTRQREVLGLRLIAELTAAETAEALGIAEATVNVHLHRALTTLRTTYGGGDGRSLRGETFAKGRTA